MRVTKEQKEWFWKKVEYALSKDDLIRYAQKKNVKVKRNDKKEKIVESLKEHLDLFEAADELRIGATSFDYRNRFGIEHADVLRLVKFNKIKRVGSYQQKNREDHYYIDVPYYDVKQFFNMTQKRMDELLLKYPKGRKKKYSKEEQKKRKQIREEKDRKKLEKEQKEREEYLELLRIEEELKNENNTLELNYLYTSFQLLAYHKRIPKESAEAKYIDYGNNTGWYYYSLEETESVDQETFDRLKEMYISKYGGWEHIDLERTSYNGKKWW